MEIKSLHALLVEQGNPINKAAPSLAPSKPDGPSFAERLQSGLEDVASSQNETAKLMTAYEMGIENDLSKVMVAQQVSSLGFQMTLNVRNKALSAYKDIMNMPV
jgi:flagellar hook-basal body complex protein FliE